MSFNSAEWWGVVQIQGPGFVLDGVSGSLTVSRGRPDVQVGVPWVDGGSWVTVGPHPDDVDDTMICDVHPFVVLARRVASRTDAWGLLSSEPNANVADVADGPVVFEWTPNPDYLGRPSTEAPLLEPVDGSLWMPPLTWHGIDGNGPQAPIVPADGVWFLRAPILASQWSGGTLRIADDELGAQTLVEFVPYIGDSQTPTQAEALGQYERIVEDDGFDWVVWLTHSDAVVSDGTDKPLVRDTSPYRREIRGSGLTRTAQVAGAGLFGNAIQIGDRADAKVSAGEVDPSLNFRSRQFTMEARISRRAPSHPLAAYSDCCLFWLGTWAFVLTARGSLAVRRGNTVRTESGAVTVVESTPGLIDLSAKDMPLRNVALTRNSAGICTIWLDGQPVGSAAFNPPSSTAAGLSGPGLRDGLAAFTRFDEVRWTNGLCRYTEPYTPSAAPFPDFGGNVEPPPGPVIGLALTGASSRSLTLDWLAPVAGGAPQGYMVEWAPAGTDFAESASMKVGVTVATITALQVHMRYDVRVFAHNASGPGKAVALMGVSTTALAVPAAPLGPVLDLADYRSLWFSWSAPEDMGDAALASYVIEVALAGSSFAQPVVGEANYWDGGEGTGSASGLQIATAYDMRVAAVTVAGRGAWATLLGNATLIDADTDAVLVDNQPLLVDGLPVVLM